MSSSDSVGEIGGIVLGIRRHAPGTFSISFGTGPSTIHFPFLPVGSLRISTGWQSPYTLSGFLGTLVSLVDHLGPNGGSGGGAVLCVGSSSSSELEESSSDDDSSSLEDSSGGSRGFGAVRVLFLFLLFSLC